MSWKDPTISQILITLSLIVGLMVSVGLAESSPGRSSYNWSKLDLLEYEITELVHPLVDSGERVGLVIGVIHGRDSGFYSYGEVVEGEMIEPDSTTLFQIASITKTFTTLLLADMVTRGEVRLNDALSNLLPNAVSVPSWSGRNITLLDPRS